MAEPDLVDLMGGERLPVRQEKASKEVVTKTFGEEMTMTQFGEWLEKTYKSRVGVTEALQQAAFMLGCDVIAQDVSKATLRLYERVTPKTSRIVMPNEHPVAAFLAADPNERHTWQEFSEMMVFWGVMTQNSFAIIFRSLAGDVLRLVPVQSGRVVERINGDQIFYGVTAGTLQEQALLGFTYADIPERNMIHVRGRMLDGMYGYSTLVAGKTTLETGAAIEKYRSQLFGEDGQIRGVFTRPDELGVLPDEAFNRLKQQMRVLMSRVAAYNDPVVLEGGVKFDRISVNPAEAELTKQFEAQINEVCRLLRVPPHKLFQLSGTKYDNLETAEKAYVGDTLKPVATRHENRVSRALLTAKERRTFFVQHDRDEMVLTDTKAETERATNALKWGGISIDEFRARLGYNELPNGQGRFRMYPAAMNIVDENGEITVGGTATNPSDGQDAPNDQPNTKTYDGPRLVSNNG